MGYLLLLLNSVSGLWLFYASLRILLLSPGVSLGIEHVAQFWPVRQREKLLGSSWERDSEKGQFVLFQWDVSTSGIAVGILSANSVDETHSKMAVEWRERTP